MSAACRSDRFCRCRGCKPPLPGHAEPAAAARGERALVAALLILSVAGAILGMRLAG